MKISQIIEEIKNLRHVTVRENTRDTVKFGDPEQECTGIALTCCATVDVIKQAAAQGCNFIIGHESAFWGDEFDPDQEFGNDEILAEKRRLLEANGIVLWRYHDYMHGGGGKPGTVSVSENIDYIFYGLMKMLEWEPYVVGDKKKPLFYEIPETTVEGLCEELTRKLGLGGLRIVGSTTGKVSKIYVCEHVMGRFDAQIIRKAADYDVLIPLEIVDWTASAYVRDAVQCGKVKTILEMGHFNTEEAGMKYMAEWLPSVLTEEVPVHYIQSGDSFSYYVR